MSGCADTCVYVDHDSWPKFHSEKIVRARKPHKCRECFGEILPGQQYERVNGCWEGEIRTYVTCLDCVEIRKHFTCGTWVYTQLWEDIREQMFPVWRMKGPFDCLAKLERESARDLCRTEFSQWLKDNDYDEQPA